MIGGSAAAAVFGAASMVFGKVLPLPLVELTGIALLSDMVLAPVALGSRVIFKLTSSIP